MGLICVRTSINPSPQTAGNPDARRRRSGQPERTRRHPRQLGCPEQEQGEAKYCVTVQTLEMIVHVYLRDDCDENIVAGGILSGTAWLYGDIVRAGLNSD